MQGACSRGVSHAGRWSSRVVGTPDSAAEETALGVPPPRPGSARAVSGPPGSCAASGKATQPNGRTDRCGSSRPACRRSDQRRPRTVWCRDRSPHPQQPHGGKRPDSDDRADRQRDPRTATAPRRSHRLSDSAEHQTGREGVVALSGRLSVNPTPAVQVRLVINTTLSRDGPQDDATTRPLIRHDLMTRYRHADSHPKWYVETKGARAMRASREDIYSRTPPTTQDGNGLTMVDVSC